MLDVIKECLIGFKQHSTQSGNLVPVGNNIYIKHVSWLISEVERLQNVEPMKAYQYALDQIVRLTKEIEQLRAEIDILTEQNRILRVNLDYCGYATTLPIPDDVHSSQPEKKLCPKCRVEGGNHTLGCEADRQW